MKIDLVRNCTHQRLLDAIHEAKASDARDAEIHIHAEAGAFVQSSAIALLACWGLSRLQHGCRFHFSGDKATLQYLARMGLQAMLGARHDPVASPVDEEGRCIALRRIEDREGSLRDGVEAIVGLVEARHAGAADFLPALQWAVTEVLDNVGNHAQSPVPGIVCGQYYPNRQRIDVAVCDLGRGIKASLSTRFPKLYSHGDAIKKAVQPGITRDLNEGQGNGLAGCVEILSANRGNLHVWSGDADLAYEDGQVKGFSKIQPLPGTGIFLQLYTNHPVDLRHLSIGGGSDATLAEVGRASTVKGPKILVRDACSHTGGRSPARTLRLEVVERLAKLDGTEQAITLDFAGVKFASSSFLDELLGRLCLELGPDRYQQQVLVVGMGDLMHGMAQKVIEQRLATGSAEVVEPRPTLVVDAAWLARLTSFDAVVLVGEDPLTDALGTSLAVRPELAMRHVPLTEGWRDRLGEVVKELAGRQILLVPSLETHDRVAAKQLGLEAMVPPAGAVLTAWLGDGTAVPSGSVLVPRGAVTSQRMAPLRELLWCRDAVRAVVEFGNSDGRIGGLSGAFEWSLLELGPLREREASHNMAFMHGEAILRSKLKPAQVQKKLEYLRGPFAQSNEFGFRAIWREATHPLLSGWHDPSFVTAVEAIVAKGPFASLSSLLRESRSGLNVSSVQLVPDEAGDIHVVRGRDLRLGDLSRVRLEDLETFKGERPPDPLQGGDVLVGSYTRGELSVAAVPEQLAGAYAGEGLLVLRVADPRVRDLLVDYLRSEFAARWLTLNGLSHFVSLPKIAELPVPTAEHEMARVSAGMRDASATLEGMRTKFEEERRRIFSIDTMSGNRAVLQDAAARARLVTDFVASIDDLSATIRRTFPLPLAEGWRAFEVGRDAEGGSVQCYDAGIRLFESAMTYLTVMLLVDLRNKARDLSSVKELLKSFHTPARGPTLGMWIEVQVQCPRIASADELPKVPFPELRQLVASDQEGPYWQAVRRMKKRRDDHAHSRGPTSKGEVKEALAGSKDDLGIIFRSLAFLARYPLRCVEDVEYDPLYQVRTVGFRDLVGDHPVVPRLREQVDAEVGRGLHIVDQFGGLRLASPWMLYDECPQCGHHELCVPEFATPKDQGSQGVSFKSLTSGHVHDGREPNTLRLAKFVGVTT